MESVASLLGRLTPSLLRVRGQSSFFQHMYFWNVNISSTILMWQLCVCVYLSTKEKHWYQVITGCSVILCQWQNSVELMTTCGLEMASLNDSWTIQCLRLGLKVKFLVMLATNVTLNNCHLIFLLKDDSWSTCPLRKDILCIFKFYVKNECSFLLRKYAHLFVLLLWNNLWEFWFPTKQSVC